MLSCEELLGASRREDQRGENGSKSGRGANPRENVIRLLLFVILVLLLVGFIVRAVMPLGEGRF